MRHAGEHCMDAEEDGTDWTMPGSPADTGQGSRSRFAELAHVIAAPCSTRPGLSWMISDAFRGSGGRTVSMA
jgi:hypothetical protein